MKPLAVENLAKNVMRRGPVKQLRFAEKLMDSMDDFTTADIAKAWQTEVTRRVEEIDNGTDPGIVAEVVHAEVRERLDGVRHLAPLVGRNGSR